MSNKSKIIISVIVIFLIGGLAYQVISTRNFSNPVGNTGNTSSPHPTGWILINGEYTDPNLVAKYNSTTTLDAPENVVYNFYQYYLTRVYGKNYLDEIPDTKLINGVYQLDPAQHQKFLSESGFFSSIFYQNEIPKIDACDQALKSVDFQKVIASGGAPEEFVQGNACEFILYHQWVGGQGQPLDTATILSSKSNNNTATVNLVVGKKINDVYSSNFSYPVVSLDNENGQWKIAAINLAATTQL